MPFVGDADGREIAEAVLAFGFEVCEEAATQNDHAEERVDAVQVDPVSDELLLAAALCELVESVKESVSLAQRGGELWQHTAGRSHPRRGGSGRAG